MITLLLIDDEQEYSKSLQINAQLSGISLLTAQNYEAGFKEIRKNPRIQGLIFDAKCWRTQQEQDDEIEPTEEAFAEALKLLGEYENSTKNYLPLVVNTGYTFPMQYFQPLLKNFQAKIFEKGTTNPDQIFDYLKEKIENSEVFEIERQFSEVLELFENSHYEHLKKDFVSIFIDLKNKQENKNTLIAIRSIYEGIVKKNLPNLKDTGKEEIYPLRDAIWKTSSHYLHPNCKTIPSSFLIKGLAFLLVEILLWYKNAKN